MKREESGSLGVGRMYYGSGSAEILQNYCIRPLN